MRSSATVCSTNCASTRHARTIWGGSRSIITNWTTPENHHTTTTSTATTPPVVSATAAASAIARSQAAVRMEHLWTKVCASRRITVVRAMTVTTCSTGRVARGAAHAQTATFMRRSTVERRTTAPLVMLATSFAMNLATGTAVIASTVHSQSSRCARSKIIAVRVTLATAWRAKPVSSLLLAPASTED